MLTLFEPDAARETPPETASSREPRSSATEAIPTRPRWWLHTMALFAGSVLLIAIAIGTDVIDAPAAIVMGIGVLGAALFGATVLVALAAPFQGWSPSCVRTARTIPRPAL